MAISDLLVEQMSLRVEWKSVSMRPGVLSVMVGGQPLMPSLPVVSWGIDQLELYLFTMLHLVQALVAFGSMTSYAIAESLDSSTVQMEELALLISVMVIMTMLD